MNFGDPNQHLGGKCNATAPISRAYKRAAVEAEHWPVYSLDNPQNFVFEQNITSHAESDWYRAEGIKYISDLILARRGTQCSGLAACNANATNKP